MIRHSLESSGIAPPLWNGPIVLQEVHFGYVNSMVGDGALRLANGGVKG